MGNFSPFGKFIGQYNASLPTLTDGDFGVMALDVNGRVMVVDGGASLTVDNAALSVVGGGVEATALRVTIANDSTGVLTVDDGGGSLTVDGTFWQATQPVSNGGTFAVQEDGAALTALQLIDDIVLTDGDVWSAGSQGVESLAVRHDATGPLTGVADGDLSPLQVNANGELKVAGTFNVQVDDVFESGTEADACSDSAGDGVVPVTGNMTDVLTIAVGAGTTYYITGLDVSGDDEVGYEVIIDDDGTPTEWIRVGSIEGNTDINKSFERAIEIAGALNRSIKVRAQALQGNSANASAAINGYTR